MDYCLSYIDRRSSRKALAIGAFSKKNVLILTAWGWVLSALPSAVKENIGYAIYVAQNGDKCPAAKPMTDISPTVFEICEDFDSDIFRAMYTAKLGDIIYILHVFKKKSKNGKETPKRDLKLIKARLKKAEDHFASIDQPRKTRK